MNGADESMRVCAEVEVLALSGAGRYTGTVLVAEALSTASGQPALQGA